MISQKACTTGSGPPIGRIWSAPVIMPSTPMKRVSRPTRIALSAIRTSASARASAPGRPRICANTARPLAPMSSAASTVRGPSRNVEIAELVANEETIVEMPCRTPPTIGR